MSEKSNKPPSVSTCYNFSIHPSDLQKLSEQLHLIEQRRARNLGAKWKPIIQEHCENIVSFYLVQLLQRGESVTRRTE